KGGAYRDGGVREEFPLCWQFFPAGMCTVHLRSSSIRKKKNEGQDSSIFCLALACETHRLVYLFTHETS
ncbi:MAG: hypothetical protein ACFCUH_10370, partial [Flavobacteriales bacterium]